MRKTVSFLNSALLSVTDECIIWPFSIDSAGYPSMGIEGHKTGRVHRIVCQKTHGDAPKGFYDASHSCGNRKCINKRHLRWATRAENAEDKRLHGTLPFGEKVWSAKLTQKDVIEIKLLAGTMSQKKLAIRYGVNQANISRLLRGEQWGHVQNVPADAIRALKETHND